MTSMIAEEVKAATLAKIEERLKKANGRRRQRVLSMNDVVYCLSIVASGEEQFCSSHGGSVPNSYGYRARTTYALAAKVGERYFLGLIASDANNPSPGRSWGFLQPWRRDIGPTGDVESKWAAWTTDPSVMELTPAEIDSIQD